MSTAAHRSTPGSGNRNTVPWVTFALLAICVILHSVVMVASRQAQASAEVKLQLADRYLIKHAYLEPGAILSERVEPSLLEQRRAIERRARNRRGAPPVLQRARKKQKQHLDQLVTEAFADASGLPPQRWGLRATEFSPLTLVSHVFLHESGVHLACASLLLLMLGFQLESAWGSDVFAGFFLLASAASGACFAIANSDFPIPLIGMSGVVAALLAAYAVDFWSIRRHPIYPFLLVAGGLFVALPVRFGHEWSLAAGFEQSAVLAVHHGASTWAVAGGLAFGLLGQWLLSLSRSSAASGGDRSIGKSLRVADPKLEKVLDARADGRLNEAHGLLCELLREKADDHEALLVMWDVALDLGRPSEAAAAMLRAIRDEVKRKDASAVVEHWIELTSRGLHTDAEPALLIRLAPMLQALDHGHAAIEALKQALQKSADADAAVVATRVARASRDLDVETARDAAWRALGSVDLDFEERQSLESMLAEIGTGIQRRESAGAGTGLEVNFDPAVEKSPADPRCGEDSGAGPAPDAWLDPSLPDDAAFRAAPRPLELDDLVEVGDGRVAPDGFQRPESIALDVSVRAIRLLAARPLALDPDGLCIEAERGAKRRLPLEKLEAISVAAVAGLSEKPILLIDLVMNWNSGADEPLKVIRLRGDQFDARTFVGESNSPLDAVRSFVGVLLRESGATALPDEQSARGMPFASFDDLAAYQGSVLGVGEDDTA